MSVMRQKTTCEQFDWTWFQYKYMNTTIIVIPHNQQRYVTVGDYWEENGSQKIVVSQLGDEKMEFLVQLHEFIESNLCRFDGIKEPDIKAFDEKFEAARKEGNADEPGDDANAPYRIQHGIATGVERIIAALIGVDWNKYVEKVESL
jgi:hypothetical protein